MIGEKGPNYPPVDGLLLSRQKGLISGPHILIGPADGVGVRSGGGDVGGGRGERDDVAEAVAVADWRGAMEVGGNWKGDGGVTATEEEGGVTEVSGVGGERRGERVEREEVRKRRSHVSRERSVLLLLLLLLLRLSIC